MSKRFKVVAIHPYKDCNLDCPMCYRKHHTDKGTKPLSFFIKMIPHLAKLTSQVALGGGEPFMKPAFVWEFAKKCKENGLICNVTSNGRLLMDMSDKVLKETLENVTMVSLSWDNAKIKNKRDEKKIFKLVKRIKLLTVCQVGCNILYDSHLDMDITFDDKFKFKIGKLFGNNFDRVFFLFPKNIDIVKFGQFKRMWLKMELFKLSEMYSHFYVDDLTRMLFRAENPEKWKASCHYGKDIISIKENGEVCGCSFDDKGVFVCEKPEDVMKAKDVKFEERYSCPYLNVVRTAEAL